ncbi:hypothetical protein PHLCEN_2v8872 [Hermanssonia centrifuga]|uniref:Uncharacterized protein n=1 Tax=Hermanssonia centrifuga TaxID=98765 RepID=A0A2R6NS91_9APHY|nr:hypothetical protein PHLCEN_2v8872 [Hermanssonia centrifuga]
MEEDLAAQEDLPRGRGHREPHVTARMQAYTPPSSQIRSRTAAPPLSQIRSYAAAALATSAEEQWEIANDGDADLDDADLEEADDEVIDNITLSSQWPEIPVRKSNLAHRFPLQPRPAAMVTVTPPAPIQVSPAAPRRPLTNGSRIINTVTPTSSLETISSFMSTPTPTPAGSHSHPRVMLTSLGTPSLKRGADQLTDTEDTISQTIKKARPKAGDVTDGMRRSLLLLACIKFRCLLSTRKAFVDSTTELDDLAVSAWFMACDEKNLPDSVLPSEDDLKVVSTSSSSHPPLTITQTARGFRSKLACLKSEVR